MFACFKLCNFARSPVERSETVLKASWRCMTDTQEAPQARNTSSLLLQSTCRHSFEKVPLPLYRFAQLRLTGSLFKALCVRVVGRLSKIFCLVLRTFCLNLVVVVNVKVVVGPCVWNSAPVLGGHQEARIADLHKMIVQH